MRKYIDETRELEATPVLVTPIVRRYFSGGKITQKGRHNLSTDGSHDLDYVQAMKRLCASADFIYFFESGVLYGGNGTKCMILIDKWSLGVLK